MNSFVPSTGHFQSLIAWCFHNITESAPSPAVNKHMVKWTSLRAHLCAQFAKKMPPVFRDFHNSDVVQQINGVPENSVCVLNGDVIQTGVQLKFNGRHICLKSSGLWYHYFRVRHFPEFLCGLIRNWCLQQPWYTPSYTTLSHISNSHWAHTAEQMWLDSSRAIT